MHKYKEMGSYWRIFLDPNKEEPCKLLFNEENIQFSAVLNG